MGTKISDNVVVSATSCVSEATVEAFSHGQLPPAELAEVEHHLAHCLRCRNQVTRVAFDFFDEPAPAPAALPPIEAQAPALMPLELEAGKLPMEGEPDGAPSAIEAQRALDEQRDTPPVVHQELRAKPSEKKGSGRRLVGTEQKGRLPLAARARLRAVRAWFEPLGRRVFAEAVLCAGLASLVGVLAWALSHHHPTAAGMPIVASASPPQATPSVDDLAKKLLRGLSQTDTAAAALNIARPTADCQTAAKSGDATGCRAALEQVEQARGADHPDVAACHALIAEALAARGEIKPALAHQELALAIWERRGGEGPEIPRAQARLGRLLLELGEYDTAQAQVSRALMTSIKQFGEQSPEVGAVLVAWGDSLAGLGKKQKALGAYWRALANLEQASTPENRALVEVLVRLGRLAFDRADYSEALAHLERARHIGESTLAPNDRALEDLLAELGQTELALKAPERALELLEHALAMREANPAVTPVQALRLADTRFALARALRDLGRDDARARALALSARASYAHTDHKSSLRTIDAWLSHKGRVESARRTVAAK